MRDAYGEAIDPDDARRGGAARIEPVTGAVKVLLLPEENVKAAVPRGLTRF